ASGSFSYKYLSVNVEGEQPRMTLRIEFVLESQGMHKPAIVSFDITDSVGVALMQALPILEGFVQPREGRQSFTVLIDLPPLIPGQYWVSPWVGSHNTETFDMIHQCAAFEVSHSPTPGRSFPHAVEHGHIVPPSRLALAGEASTYPNRMSLTENFVPDQLHIEEQISSNRSSILRKNNIP